MSIVIAYTASPAIVIIEAPTNGKRKNWVRNAPVSSAKPPGLERKSLK
ncbi:MAG: hypothetical protein IMZ64_14650 [Bacteroidetes bacterium]|nr:hypothetical protein [Bacteroidota bacterium]